MKTRSQMEEEQRLLNRRKYTLILAAAAVVLVAGVTAIILLVGSGRATVKGTLAQYYQTMYTDNGKGFQDMADCFAPDLSEDWYNNNTVFGINFSALTDWRFAAIEQVGNNVTCAVKITETDPGSSTDLAQMKQTYSGAQAISDVIFELHLSGDTGTMVTHGVVELVKIDGKWYFTVTDIPMTVTSRTGSAQEWFEKNGDQGD
ncbi:MAG: hypothetical protein VB086_01230 [Clostridiaceae bacterium]|nr:hypothetical protein [Clostridiaceae bacterium]